MDFVPGHCPVPGLPGLFPECPWTLSRLSNESIVKVQGVQGKSPGIPGVQVFPGLSTDGSGKFRNRPYKELYRTKTHFLC